MIEEFLERVPEEHRAEAEADVAPVLDQLVGGFGETKQVGIRPTPKPKYLLR